jgi:hypothetical protein
MSPIVDPVYKDGAVKFLLGNGTSRKLVFSCAELEALRSLIDQRLEAYRARIT